MTRKDAIFEKDEFDIVKKKNSLIMTDESENYSSIGQFIIKFPKFKKTMQNFEKKSQQSTFEVLF